WVHVQLHQQKGMISLSPPTICNSALMTALPDHAASPLMTRLQDELCTESVRGQAREQFTGAVDRIFDTAESVCVASVARTVLRAVRDTVVSVARAVWNWIFF
ncbi:hypothetical protein ACRFCP_27950, partial [Klebsiella pneumoniae]